MDGTLHIGHLVKAELQRQGKTTTWLAAQIGCSRMNTYKIYRRPWITTDMLYKVSAALHHNFFSDLSANFDAEFSTASNV